jgi:peptidoglycan/xylan/chitin deacetylase (PgdA/CDA1 family)
MTEHLRLRSAPVGVVKEAVVSAQVLRHRLVGATTNLLPILRILTYHRISDDNDQLAIAPARFRRQLEYLARLDIPVVDLATAVASPAPGDALAVALTFDDGYRDFADHALEQLRRHGFPATVFVCPDVIAGTAAFSWYAPGRQPPVLGWDEMREIERTTGVRFEPHSLSHPDLRAVDDDRAWTEIAGSRDAVRRELGREPQLFCYPGGYVTARDVALVQRAGFIGAVTTEEGVNRSDGDSFMLSRTQIDRYDFDFVFRARLHGATDGGIIGRRRRDT